MAARSLSWPIRAIRSRKPAPLAELVGSVLPGVLNASGVVLSVWGYSSVLVGGGAG